MLKYSQTDIVSITVLPYDFLSIFLDIDFDIYISAFNRFDVRLNFFNFINKFFLLLQLDYLTVLSLQFFNLSLHDGDIFFAVIQLAVSNDGHFFFGSFDGIFLGTN